MSRILVTVAAITLALATPIAAPARPAAAQAPPPKVAVVVAGDPDDTIRAAAERVDTVLRDTEALRIPADPGLRRALRGEPADEEDDGLGRARSARRELGWDEEKDLPVLVSIGRMAGADAVVVVRHGEPGPEAVMVDVGARAYFDGSLALADTPDGEMRSFAQSRAHAAAEREDAAVEEPVDEGRVRPARDSGGAAVTDEAATDDETGEEATGAGPWFRKNWAYLVAGVLLVGTVTAFIVRDQRDDGTNQAAFRFVPGGSE